MHTIKRVVIGLNKIACVLIVAAALQLSGCKSLVFTCEDTIKTEAKSPDGKNVAVLFERDCGATTDVSTIVSLRSISTKLDEQEGRVFVIEGQHQIALVWEENTRLRIDCSRCSTDDVFKQEKKWHDVSISY